MIYEIICNLTSGGFSLSGREEESTTKIRIGFVPGTSLVPFNNLSFGFSIFSAGDVVQVSYPKEGQKFIASDQKFLTSDIVPAGPCSLWVSNGGRVFTYNLVIGE